MPASGYLIGQRLHGQSGHGGKCRPTSLYHRWVEMRARCRYCDHPRYKDYGGRGIAVCAEWDDFASFERWAIANGYRPELSIDRIDNDGPYSPENCRWADSTVQSRNRSCVMRIAYGGKTACLAEHAADAGLSYGMVKHRLRRGWSIDDALATPPKSPGNPKACNKRKEAAPCSRS